MGVLVKRHGIPATATALGLGLSVLMSACATGNQGASGPTVTVTATATETVTATASAPTIDGEMADAVPTEEASGLSAQAKIGEVFEVGDVQCRIDSVTYEPNPDAEGEQVATINWWSKNTSQEREAGCDVELGYDAEGLDWEVASGGYYSADAPRGLTGEGERYFRLPEGVEFTRVLMVYEPQDGSSQSEVLVSLAK